MVYEHRYQARGGFLVCRVCGVVRLAGLVEPPKGCPAGRDPWAIKDGQPLGGYRLAPPDPGIRAIIQGREQDMGL